MGEFNHEKLRSPEFPPRRDPDQALRDLGRTAIDGAQRQERKERVAPALGRTALGRDRKSEPPREERNR